MSTIALERNIYNTKSNAGRMTLRERLAASVKESMPYIVSGMLSMDGRTNAYQICSMLQGK